MTRTNRTAMQSAYNISSRSNKTNKNATDNDERYASGNSGRSGATSPVIRDVAYQPNTNDPCAGGNGSPHNVKQQPMRWSQLVMHAARMMSQWLIDYSVAVVVFCSRCPVRRLLLIASDTFGGQLRMHSIISERVVIGVSSARRNSVCLLVLSCISRLRLTRV